MHASAIRRYRRLRPGLALIRLGLIYISICFTLLFLGLVLRAHSETDPGLAEQLPPANAAGMNIPRIGVTVELEQYAAPARRDALQRLEEQGIGWVRQRLDWRQIETIKGQFDWDPIDSMVSTVAGPVFSATTGAQIPIDGGNDRVI